jgi:hypothetical protein
MKTTAYTESTPQAPAPDNQRLPDALFGGKEVLDGAEDTDSLWSRFYPRDVPFFKMALLDQLLRRPYHAVALEGPFHVKKLAQDYRAQVFRSETSINRSGAPCIDRLLLVLGDGVFAYLDDEVFKLYAPSPQSAEAAALKFRRYVKPTAPGKPRFYVVAVNPEGPDAETVVIERAAPVATEELALNYGEDFPAWEEEWTERMRRVPSGLTILFGPPGCGKTSYLRALMSRLLDKAVFYFVPLSESEMLSDPRFVNFWVAQTRRHGKKQKIAILEDAEELLLTRDGGTRDKGSNLLNIADGFLGDHLKLHVIATTNVPISKLDPAIVRPGRLIGVREFRRLTRKEALRVAEAKGIVLPDQADFSLAEIYCARAKTERLGQPQKIGFA